MKLDPVVWIQLLGYGSLILELSIWAVPSVASSRQILASESDTSLGSAGALTAARSRSGVAKLLRYGLPTGCGMLLFLLPLALILAPDWRAYLGPLAMEVSPGLRWSGALLLILGRVVALLGARELRRDQLTALARSGIFRLTRNPIVVGMHAFFLGHLLIFPCLALVGGLVLYVFYMHGRVRMEEDFLAAKFGADYEPYRRSVPRYVFL